MDRRGFFARFAGLAAALGVAKTLPTQALPTIYGGANYSDLYTKDLETVEIWVDSKQLFVSPFSYHSKVDVSPELLKALRCGD